MAKRSIRLVAGVRHLLGSRRSGSLQQARQQPFDQAKYRSPCCYSDSAGWSNAMASHPPRMLVIAPSRLGPATVATVHEQL
jgi:hypothetical protein